VPPFGESKPFQRAPVGGGSQYDGNFSPDGHWLAYFSDETGQPGSLRRSISGAGWKIPDSHGGGWIVRSEPEFTGQFFTGIAASAFTLNRDTRGTSIQVGARHNDQFPTQGVAFLLRSTRFEHSPADPDHHPLEYGSNKLSIGYDRFAGALQHPDDCLIEPDSHLLHDLRSVHVGAYRIKSDTRLRIPHLGLKKRRDESSYHLTEWFSLLFLANEFYSFSELNEVTFQGSL